jgi:hypothetical protein
MAMVEELVNAFVLPDSRPTSMISLPSSPPSRNGIQPDQGLATSAGYTEPMRIVATGSIAFDYPMSFPKFTEHCRNT